MKWRKVMAFSLAASMIAGQAVSAAPAPEAKIRVCTADAGRQ